MRNILLNVAGTVLILAGFGHTLSAQEKTEDCKRNLVKINPLSLGLLTANFQFEHVINDRFSWQVGAFGGAVGLRGNNTSGSIYYNWYGITPEIRYYSTFSEKKIPKGLYFGPFLRFRYILARYTDEVSDPDQQDPLIAEVRGRIPVLSGGVLVGYQFVMGNKVSLEFFGGPHYSTSKENLEVICPTCNGNEETYFKGVDLNGLGVRAGLSLGIAF